MASAGGKPRAPKTGSALRFPPVPVPAFLCRHHGPSILNFVCLTDAVCGSGLPRPLTGAQTALGFHQPPHSTAPLQSRTQISSHGTYLPSQQSQSWVSGSSCPGQTCGSLGLPSSHIFLGTVRNPISSSPFTQHWDHIKAGNTLCSTFCARRFLEQSV